MMECKQCPEIIEIGDSSSDITELEEVAENKSLIEIKKLFPEKREVTQRHAQLQFEKSKAQALVTWQRFSIIR